MVLYVLIEVANCEIKILHDETFNLTFTACASGWTSFGYTGYCYRHFASPKPWAEAKRFCELIAPHGETGNLVSVGDHFTNTFLSAITRNKVWIGGYQDGDKWAWSDDSTWKYSLWASGL